jgi:hypothetical protein
MDQYLKDIRRSREQVEGFIKIKKIIFSIAGYIIATMIPAVLWHLVLFKEKYHAMGAFTREEPIMPLGMTAVILQALVFAYFYPMYLKYNNQTATISNGIKYSLLMGINVWTVMVFATGAKIRIEPIMDFILLGTAFQLIQFILVGASLGFVHKSFDDGP